MSPTAIACQTCKYPGCGQPATSAAGTGRPPEYCAGSGHTRVSAWRERRRHATEQAGAVISPAEGGSPLTTAKMTGAELLRSLRAEADRIAALGAGLRDRIDTLTDQPPPKPKSRRSAPPPSSAPPPKPAPQPPRSALQSDWSMQRRRGTRCAPRLPANAMRYERTCEPAPSAPSSKLMPTAANWTGSAPPAQQVQSATAAVQHLPGPRGAQPASRPPDTSHCRGQAPRGRRQAREL